MATIDDPALMQRILAHLGLPDVRDGPPRTYGLGRDFGLGVGCNGGKS